MVTSKSEAAKFNLLIKGIRSGFSRDEVIENIGKTYNLGLKDVEKFFMEKPVPVAEELDSETAIKYRDIVEKMGCICAIEEYKIPPNNRWHSMLNYLTTITVAGNGPPYLRVATVINFLGFLTLLAVISIVLAVFIPSHDQYHWDSKTAATVSILVFFISIPLLILRIAYGIKKHKKWGRTGGIIYAAMLLLGIPVGTLIGSYILWHLIRNWDEV